MARVKRKTKGKGSAEESKWGSYLRQIKALPFVDKDNRVSWWGVPKRGEYPPAKMPYLRDDHNLDDASPVLDIALGMLCEPLPSMSAELANLALLTDAARLESWLLQYCLVQETHVVKAKYAKRYGPLRNEDALNNAVVSLARLNRARWIKIEKRYTRRGANHIQVNSMLLVAQALS